MGNCLNTTDDLTKYKNCAVKGKGGELADIDGRIVCVLACFDYNNPQALQYAGCPPLTCSQDGSKFSKLVKDCDVELYEYFDSDPVNFPRQAVIKQKWAELGKELGAGDCFIFYYAGHGNREDDKDGDESDAMDEEMCFVEPDGRPMFWLDDDVSKCLAEYFKPEVHILFVTDCCHCGSMCDLSKDSLKGRPILHVGAVKDNQEAVDLGSGGAFTTSLMESVEELSRDRDEHYSIVDLYNTIYGKFEDRFSGENQTFAISWPSGYDPDTFPWPLIPYDGWEIKTAFDGFGNKQVLDLEEDLGMK